jgi:hypothetical protein
MSCTNTQTKPLFAVPIRHPVLAVVGWISAQDIEFLFNDDFVPLHLLFSDEWLLMTDKKPRGSKQPGLSSTTAETGEKERKCESD